MQDRFAIIWDGGANGDEGADCRTMCHAVGDTTPNGDRMYLDGAGWVDVWHWQAGTTDPVLLAEDEYWTAQGRNPDLFTQEIYTKNYDNQLLQPIYMRNNAAVNDTVFNYEPILHADEAVPFDSTLVWFNRARVPGYVVHDNAAGSIADVKCFSGFNRMNGRWMVLMRRALNTGNIMDDFDFSSIAPGDSVMATIAFMDHDDDMHYGSRPFYIVFP
jgi:hypothetical protein